MDWNRVEGNWKQTKGKIKEGQLTDDDLTQINGKRDWPAPGSADTELGVLMEPEVCHGETEVYT